MQSILANHDAILVEYDVILSFQLGFCTPNNAILSFE